MILLISFPLSLPSLPHHRSHQDLLPPRPEELKGSSDPLSGILRTHSDSSTRAILPSLVIGGSALATSRVQQLNTRPSDPRDPMSLGQR
jgi:hypothetical protein